MTMITSLIILQFVIMDPLGNLPIFISILKNTSASRRRFIIIREMIIALIFMLLFLFLGEKILSVLNLKTEIVSISGGIVLFLIAIPMIFPSFNQISNNNDQQEKQSEPFLVPLAIPLIAGPSLLATLILLSHQYASHMWYLLISLFISWFISLFILLSSNLFLKLLGKKGINALERLMGLVLIMLSTQMFLNGIGSWFKI
ncbi:putative integral membrane protein [Buchnera aphidicola (Cinara tujafilina)]|uniref:UPF0056 membrane protein n=1 Tax=Buchnera aphidicola (Cinara tujafilina) TaxID=261317 RepID=F7WZJ9_9GAMM|nr:YhgN family NAAT transporter [Buchnera aphidicola]AEH39866.1 putative integral membrane protein [Buchnera aphidicola (Cinara tujafilina)]